ncbi:MAG TPA: MCE family protein, partial [Erythrobacter sp.]|nr:MCE family protein [Erythrobacter sp.]
ALHVFIGGGFGAVLASAPLLLERLATLTERLTVLLSDRNQEEISQILANTNAASAGFAAAAPQLERTMAELQVTLREASEALDQFEQVTASTDRIINQEGEAIARDLRSTLKSASGAARALEDTLNEARPATKQLTESTLPAAEATLRDLRATSKALRDVTETIDEKGAGALLSSQPLPDYKP